MFVTVAQTLLLPSQMVGGQAHWSQGAIGWCLLPLLLSLPTRHGSALLENLIRSDGLMVVGAKYSLETGMVDFFDGAPSP